MPLTISRLSVEYVRVPVRATQSGVAVDPTSDTVTMSFTTAGAQPSTWNAATWETDATTTPAKHYARCLVGPGAVVLTAGLYAVWVKLVDSPERPVLLAGELAIR